MKLPAEIESCARAHEHDAPRHIHSLIIDLAALVLETAPPAARAQLSVARRFNEGVADAVELADARQDAWTYIVSLACGCSAADSASAGSILVSLEFDQSRHTLATLLEQVERTLAAGAAPESVRLILSDRHA